MDASTARRLAAVGLAVTIPASVYAVTSGDWLKATISLIGFGGSLLWGFWPDIRRRYGIGNEDETLQFEPLVCSVAELFGDLDQAEKEALKAEAIYAAAVRVSNASREPLELSVATGSSLGPSWELAWSREPGALFVRGGANVAPLPVGASRLILVAIGYLDLGWHRYDQGLHSKPSRYFTLDGLFSYEGVQRGIAQSLATEGVRSRYIRLRFRAANLDIASGFRLLFSRTALGFIAAGSPEDRQPSRAFEQAPPSSPESSGSGSASSRG